MGYSKSTQCHSHNRKLNANEPIVWQSLFSWNTHCHYHTLHRTFISHKKGQSSQKIIQISHFDIRAMGEFGHLLMGRIVHCTRALNCNGNHWLWIMNWAFYFQLKSHWFDFIYIINKCRFRRTVQQKNESRRWI